MSFSSFGLWNHIRAFALSISVASCYSVLVVFGVLSVLSKTNFFIQVILLEVRLILVCMYSLPYISFVWFFLPILGLGACEGSCGLSLAVHLSRSVDLALASV